MINQKFIVNFCVSSFFPVRKMAIRIFETGFSKFIETFKCFVCFQAEHFMLTFLMGFNKFCFCIFFVKL